MSAPGEEHSQQPIEVVKDCHFVGDRLCSMWIWLSAFFVLFIHFKKYREWNFKLQLLSFGYPCNWSPFNQWIGRKRHPPWKAGNSTWFRSGNLSHGTPSGTRHKYLHSHPAHTCCHLIVRTRWRQGNISYTYVLHRMSCMHRHKQNITLLVRDVAREIYTPYACKYHVRNVTRKMVYCPHSGSLGGATVNVLYQATPEVRVYQWSNELGQQCNLFGEYSCTMLDPCIALMEHISWSILLMQAVVFAVWNHSVYLNGVKPKELILKRPSPHPIFSAHYTATELPQQSKITHGLPLHT